MNYPFLLPRVTEESYTQPQNERYSQITEYFTGIITPQAFPQVEIRLDRLLLF
jgi:hypothetical protein